MRRDKQVIKIESEKGREKKKLKLKIIINNYYSFGRAFSKTIPAQNPIKRNIDTKEQNHFSFTEYSRQVLDRAIRDPKFETKHKLIKLWLPMPLNYYRYAHCADKASKLYEMITALKFEARKNSNKNT